MDVNRSRMAGGEATNATRIAAGTSSVIHRRQNHTRYRPATAVPIQMARVSPSSTATAISPAHINQTHDRLRVPAKNRKAPSMIRANISSAEKVFQWLVKSV